MQIKDVILRIFENVKRKIRVDDKMFRRRKGAGKRWIFRYKAWSGDFTVAFPPFSFLSVKMRLDILINI